MGGEPLTNYVESSRARMPTVNFKVEARPKTDLDNLKIKERSLGTITTKKNSCSRRCSQKRRSMSNSKSKDKEGKEEERRKQIVSPKLSSSSIYALKQN